MRPGQLQLSPLRQGHRQGAAIEAPEEDQAADAVPGPRRAGDVHEELRGHVPRQGDREGVPGRDLQVRRRQGGDARVKQKALALVQEWALQLQLPQYRAAFDELRRKGERFPPTELTSAEVTPMYTPRPNRVDIVEQRLAQMDPADAAAVRAAVAAAEAEVEAEERRLGTGLPRVSNGMSPGGGSTPVVGSPPGRGFRVGSPPGSSARAPPGLRGSRRGRVLHGGTAGGTAERTYSDGNPYGTAGGAHVQPDAAQPPHPRSGRRPSCNRPPRMRPPSATSRRPRR